MIGINGLDVASRDFAKGVVRRFVWYAGCVAVEWLLLTTHSAISLVEICQFTCTCGALVAVVRGLISGTAVNARSLTFWDEGLLLNLIAVGMHMTRGLLA